MHQELQNTLCVRVREFVNFFCNQQIPWHKNVSNSFLSKTLLPLFDLIQKMNYTLKDFSSGILCMDIEFVLILQVLKKGYLMQPNLYGLLLVMLGS